MQSVPITTKIVSSNPVHDEVYSIQQYVIKFVRDLQQVGGFLRVLVDLFLLVYEADFFHWLFKNKDRYLFQTFYSSFMICHQSSIHKLLALTFGTPSDPFI